MERWIDSGAFSNCLSVYADRHLIHTKAGTHLHLSIHTYQSTAEIHTDIQLVRKIYRQIDRTAMYTSGAVGVKSRIKKVQGQRGRDFGSEEKCLQTSLLNCILILIEENGAGSVGGHLSTLEAGLQVVVGLLNSR